MGRMGGDVSFEKHSVEPLMVHIYIDSLAAGHVKASSR
jgi:hypothetical protein